MRSGSVRAWPSVVMLAGFGLVAAVHLALVTVPVWLLLSALPGSAAVRLGVPLCIATVGVMASATWRALHRRRNHPPGIPIARADAPGLWALVDAAAHAAGVRPPDGVTVIADPSAALIEHSRLLGLIGGHRDLYLGMPLLLAWDVAGLRAAVAHEFGHESRALGRLAPVASRGRVAVGRVVPRIACNNPAGPLIRLWANWYRRVDAPLARAQELTADRVAARFAGADAAAAVLRDRPALETLVHVFQTEYVAPGRRAGHVPEDLFGGLLHVLAARADEMAALRHRELPDPPTWDPHPPRRDRLAALAAIAGAGVPGPVDDAAKVSYGSANVAPPNEGGVPSAPPAKTPLAVVSAGPGLATGVGPADVEPTGVGPAAGVGPAGELVPDLPGLARALQAVAYPAQGRSPAGWEAFFDAARTDEMEREAEDAVAAVSRVLGASLASAADVLDAAADGRLRKAVEGIFPDRPADEVESRIGELVTLVLALAALRAGAARWRHSWTGAAELVTPDGGHLDLGQAAGLAVDPSTAGSVREWLSGLGVDPAAAAPPGPGAAVRPEVVGGVVNLVVDGSRTDLLIVDTGLFLIPGLPRAQNGSAKRRLAQFAAADVPLRDRTAPGSRFVPYADLAGAAQTRRTPKSWDLNLKSGGRLTVRTALDSDELPGGWAALDHAVAFLSRATA